MKRTWVVLCMSVWAGNVVAQTPPPPPAPVEASAPSEPAKPTEAAAPTEAPKAAPAPATPAAPEAPKATPASQAPAAPATEETAPPLVSEADSFYKGELGTPGAPDLLNPNDAIFVGVGYYNIGGLLGQHFARLTPQVDLHFKVAPEKQLTLRLQAPLNMTLYDQRSTASNKGLGTFRPNDYDETGDYLKFIKQIQLGRKEDKIFANIGLTRSVNLGHGTVMRRYNANLDPDRSRLGLQFDAYNEYGGFETFIGDLSFASPVLGGLVFAKPFSLFSKNPILRTFSLGAHYTTDLRAPKSLQRNDDGSVITDRTNNYPKYSTTQVSIIGFDSEIKPLKLGNLLDFKLYVDYSKIVGAGGGMTMGTLLRGNVGARPLLSALRMRLEGRLYDADYRPEYFNSVYEIQKLQMRPGGRTKYEEVVKSTDISGHASVYAEASYALVDKISLGLGLERIVDMDQYNMLVHLEVPAFEILRLYASYQKFNFKDLGQSFATAPGKSFAFEPDAILFSQARLMVLPILFVSAGLRQQFLWSEAKSSYVPNLDYLVETQLGFEF